MMPMDHNPMVIILIPPMTIGVTILSTNQGKQLPMAMTTIQHTTVMKMMIENHMEGDINMCNPIIVTANQ